MQPFRIHVPEQTLDDLRKRLARTVWPDELEDANGRFGLPVSYMKQLVDHWQNKYNWRDHEFALNAFPQFMAEVEGQRIHFIHQRGKGTNPIPIIMTHGWPGSFAEFTKVIPRLTDPATGDSFDVLQCVFMRKRDSDLYTSVQVIASLYRAQSRALKRKRHFHLANGLSAVTTLRNGASSLSVVISRRWKNQNFLLMIFELFSESYDEHDSVTYVKYPVSPTVDRDRRDRVLSC